MWSVVSSTQSSLRIDARDDDDDDDDDDKDFKIDSCHFLAWCSVLLG